MRNPTAWLRWQLTQRHGLLWHETCASCEAWEGDDVSADGYAGCGHTSGRDMHREDACTNYSPSDEAIETDATRSA